MCVAPVQEYIPLGSNERGTGGLTLVWELWLSSLCTGI